ncbi:MAG: hypothetical protein DSM106950_26705 [Stigonema ocellatum SAG 48.90 = DSM 106950]|nr:hypothetical protein [Stigonema ocellatum SAG 48.90 = DSM 106950]
MELQKLSQLPAIHWQRRCNIIERVSFSPKFTKKGKRGKGKGEKIGDRSFLDPPHFGALLPANEVGL